MGQWIWWQVVMEYRILSMSTDIQTLEWIGRLAYKSEPKGDPDRFIRKILTNKHESVIEHLSASVWFKIDRGLSHELVRHRLASFTQVSTRYVNYGKKPIEFIPPSGMNAEQCQIWQLAVCSAERAYLQMLEAGAKPEVARSVLPNSLATEIVMTANFREWRHVFKLRCSPQAHPDMRLIMSMVRDEFRERCPVIFDE
jgi:thymidylate synthase (FAD)